ncbi:MAG: acetylxylan esterase [Chthoniobacter sp.]|nr:acetylxylan esterase [Chthoniobacter sp.]
MKLPLLVFAFLALATGLRAADAPQSVSELWADFDPRRDPLEVEVVREWREDGLVLRTVRFLVGTFKGRPARLAAFYGFPDGAKEKLPGVMHIHGGGQRASLAEVKFLALRGYAALSVNWGGREMENAQAGDANTDWGAVDPTQQNVPGYNSILPGPKQFFEDREHPKNNNWYLLTLGCRRGLTFLERQPEVDPQRLGIHGFSMGGNLTMYVAGTDARVKCAVPAVGGQGWRTEPHEFIGGEAKQEPVTGNVDWFRRTLSFENYAPLIRCPVLHRSATNDFHGWMDDVYRTQALIENQPVRQAWSPHMNHRLSPEVAVTMPLWLDHFLKGGPALPETPGSELTLHTTDGVAVLRVRGQPHPWPITRCEIYYSIDPDPRARFWRSAAVAKDGGEFLAKLPLEALDRPLFAFANVYYRLPQPVNMVVLGGFKPEQGSEVCLSTQLHAARPADLKSAGVKATERSSLLIDDFAQGLRDWYSINADHPPLWQYWTRKVTDPKWRGPDKAVLSLTLAMPDTNRLTFVAIENEYRSYRGPKRIFVCEREVTGIPQSQAIALEATDFKDGDGKALANWQQLDEFAICAHYEDHEHRASPTPAQWHGARPLFQRLEWVMDATR